MSDSSQRVDALATVILTGRPAAPPAPNPGGVDPSADGDLVAVGQG